MNMAPDCFAIAIGLLGMALFRFGQEVRMGLTRLIIIDNVWRRPPPPTNRPR